MTRKTENVLDCATLLYLSLPVSIFFIGWLRPSIAFVLILILGVGLSAYLKTISSQPAGWSKLKKGSVLLVGLLAFCWVYLSGIGGYANQDWDHHYRNAVFHDLIRYEWPVYFQFSPNFDIDFLAGHNASLNYYFTFWLPAAVVGKLFGQNAANGCLLGWTYIGVLLAFFQLFRLIKFNNLIIAAVVFALWSGLDVLGKLLVQKHIVQFTEPIEMYYYFSYTSFTTDLFNVFNQAIPAWLVTLWVLHHRQKIPMLPIALLFPYGPFPFISLSLFYVVYFIVDAWQRQQVRTPRLLIQHAWTRVDLLSAVAAVVAIGFPYVAFYKAHAPVHQNQFFGVRFIGESFATSMAIIGYYLVTFILEAGLFFVLIRWLAPSLYREKKLMFWLSFLMLLAIPLWEAGIWRDFASRGSIPMLTVLAVLTIQAVTLSYQQKRYQPALLVTALVIALSWVTPFWLLRKAPALGTAPRLRDDIVSLGNPRIRSKTDKDGVLSSLPYYYSMDPEHKFFYRLLAKRQVPKDPERRQDPDPPGLNSDRNGLLTRRNRG